jgi:alpha-N-arabinofuranosidase
MNRITSRVRYLPGLAAFLLLTAAAGCAKGPPPAGVPNASFEDPDPERPAERPADWQPYRWGGRGELEYAESGHTGVRSVTIASTEGADLSWGAVLPVRPFSRYRLSGWIRTEDLTATTGQGALFNLHGMEGARSEALTGTRDWTRVAFEFDTGANDAVQVNCLFGGWGQATGRAWYDDLSLELLATREPRPSVTIDAARTAHPISEYIYGQFIEHLGRGIYGGIWAEMLEDRKCFYAPGTEDSPWRVLGDPARLVMDRRTPYVGTQTPVLDPAPDGETAGLVQAGLGLVAGKTYEGRIVLRGEVGAAPVSVSLAWGEGPADRQTVSIDRIPSTWEKIPLRFTAGASTDDGRLEITAGGRGRLRVGTVSLMPSDNVEGFRPDVLALLRELDAPVYRWPGGNFVSGYDWRDGIGDRDRRPPRKNPAWQGIEHNDVGLHEFLRLCELIDTEPYITVNTGLGSPEQAADELAYCNGPADSPLGRLRAGNGHPEPFGVKWWAIGNEMYGDWQLGHIPLDQYVEKHRRTVAAMRAVDPSIRVVAVGAVGEWDEVMLAQNADAMDLISEHFYCQERPGLLGHAACAAERVKRIGNAHRRYRETIPALAGRDLRIAMDEWNYWYGPYLYGELGTRYYLKDALGVARGLHEYYRNSDVYFMANYAQTVNVIGAIKTTKTDAAFDATGLVLRLYRRNYGNIPVTVAGMPEPLDVAAAWTTGRDTLVVAVVNPTRETLRLPLHVAGARLTGGGRRLLLSGPDPLAYNEPGGRTDIVTTETPVRRLPDRLRVPPLSVALYRLAALPAPDDPNLQNGDR